MGRFGFPFLLSAMSVLLAHAFRKPFYVMPQSIGPLKRAWERWLIKKLYGKARIIFVRDNITLDLARNIGLPSQKIRYAPDLAFDYMAVELESNKLPNAFQLHDLEYGAIGVTVIRKMTRTLLSEDIEHYYYAMAAALKRMIQQYNMHVYFFPQVTGPTSWEDDRIAAKRVIQLMEGVQQKISLIEEPLTPQVLKFLYGYMDIFIAGRLHSGIFALGRGVPTLFIGYLTKTRGVTDSIGMNEWVLDFKNLSEHDLYSKIEELWLNRVSVKEHLLQKLPIIVHLVRTVGREIANDFIGGGG
jgi:colanic acid/amylovoran biosynthesis protein